MAWFKKLFGIKDDQYTIEYPPSLPRSTTTQLRKVPGDAARELQNARVRFALQNENLARMRQSDSTNVEPK